MYDARRGTFADLGVLDVQQIFGRAGRPQFDTSGCGIIITTHNKLPHYLGAGPAGGLLAPPLRAVRRVQL